MTSEADNPDRRQLCIDLTLHKTVDAAEVAQSIAQRAARHRLRHAPAGHRDHYAGLAAVARLPLPRLDRFAVYQLATSARTREIAESSSASAAL